MSEAHRRNRSWQTGRYPGQQPRGRQSAEWARPRHRYNPYAQSAVPSCDSTSKTPVRTLICTVQSRLRKQPALTIRKGRMTNFRRWLCKTGGNCHMATDSGTLTVTSVPVTGLIGQQAVLAKKVRGVTNGREWQPGALGNVQQRVLAIREIQDPKTRVDFCANRLPAGAAVQVSLAQLGLAAWILVQIDRLFSSTSTMEAHTRSDRASCCGRIKSRLSADVWYSGKFPTHSASGSRPEG